MKHWRGKSGLVTKLGTVPLVLLALGASAPLQSCASEPLDNGGAEQVGSVGVNLVAAPGVTLSSVTYSITGNGFDKTGSIDISGSSTISGTIGGIPAGKGYTLTLSATSTDGRTSFTGSANFDVAAGKTTSLTIHLKGTTSAGNGSVTVNGTLNVGPVIDELTVTPLSVNVGRTITLESVASDADNAPAALSYYWSTTGGIISDPVAANATLTSATPGTFTVKLTVSDGEITASSFTSVTFVDPEAGSGGVGGGSGEGPQQPNVLLIIADDWGAESTSLYPDLVGDSGAVPVPTVESLADNGLVFDNAWASPACSMTRGTIVSGLYGYRTGVTSVGAVLPTETVTLFDRLSTDSPDYAHALFGKYHLGGGLFDPRAGGTFADAPKILQHVRDIGVTNFRGILGGALTDYYSWNIYDTNGPAVPTTSYATTALTDVAIDYIHQQEATRPDKPWFIYQAYNAPHAANGPNSPYQVPPPYLHSVDLSSVGDPAAGTSATNVPVYKANIQALDTEIGRLLKEVDLDDTVVIFIGDNGTPAPVKDTGAHIRGSKGSAYEGGVRVPFVVAGAGVTRRGRADDLVVTTDLYATILSLTGVNVSHVNNSYSIKPLLSDETATSGRTYSFAETSSGTSNRFYGLKDKRYKLVSNLGKRELYDLIADPQETTNLYASAAHTAVRASLEAEIDTLNADARPGYFP
jgi:arylsulfatase A-like enzyme